MTRNSCAPSISVRPQHGPYGIRQFPLPRQSCPLPFTSMTQLRSFISTLPLHGFCRSFTWQEAPLPPRIRITERLALGKAERLLTETPRAIADTPWHRLFSELMELPESGQGRVVRDQHLPSGCLQWEGW